MPKRPEAPDAVLMQGPNRASLFRTGSSLKPTKHQFQVCAAVIGRLTRPDWQPVAHVKAASGGASRPSGSVTGPFRRKGTRHQPSVLGHRGDLRGVEGVRLRFVFWND